MSADQISLDPEAAAALADRWDQYADELGQYLASTQPDMEQLSNQLGPIYSAFVQAKALETTERGLSYERVIAWARSHAQKLRVIIGLASRPLTTTPPAPSTPRCRTDLSEDRPGGVGLSRKGGWRG